MSKKIIVGLYTRVSTAEQATDGYSIGEQKNRLEKYAEAHDWTVYKLYSDPGISGGTMDRPGLQDMIKDVKAGKLDKVVVYKLDRLSRSQKDTLYLIEEIFKKSNVDFVSMTENFDTGTPLGIAMIGILSVFAQLERAQIKERLKMGKIARANAGLWHGGGRTPIGYDYDPSTNTLVVNDFEKLQVVELANRFISGESFNQIEVSFNKKGYVHKYGRWIVKTMRAVLKSKVYLGYISSGGSWIKGDHESILSEEYYDRIQDKLKLHESNYEAFKDNSHKSLLGGLIYCGNCGARYYKKSGGKNRYDYFCCYSRGPKPYMVKDPSCKNPNVRVDKLEDLVIGEIKKLQAEPTNIKKLIQDKPDQVNKNDVINSEIDKIESQISKLIDLYSLGSVPYETIDKKIQALTTQRDALQSQIVDEDPQSDKITESEAVDILASVGEIFNSGSLEDKRAIIASLIKRIEIYSDTIKIYWRFI